MRSVIEQRVVLPARAEALFEMYIDPVTHEAITGAAATIGAEKGAVFRAFDGVLSGTTLCVVAPNLIIQSWRSTNFRVEDRDSTLILSFSPQGDEGRIDLVHLDVPEHDYDGVDDGWEKYYWKPWREYLTGR